MIASRLLFGLLFVSGCLVGLTGKALAQQPSVVQLPTFQFFTYSGSVLVPDTGGAYLGGVKRAASSSSRRGLNRAVASPLGNSGAFARATIIDNDEIDRRLLGGAPQEFVEKGRRRGTRVLTPTDEGKALVRFARKQYREGDRSGSFQSYRMAIGLLTGRLRDLATVEFKGRFGVAAEQSLTIAALPRRSP